MGLVMLQVLDLVLIVSVFSCSLVIQGSAEHSLAPSLSAVPPVGEGTPGFVSNISIAPAPVSQPNGTDLQPPPITPPLMSAPVPQPTNGLLPPSIWPGPSSPPNHFGPPTESIQDSVPSVPPVASHSEPPPFTLQAPAPIRSPASSSPPTEQTHPTMPGPMPPISHQTRAPTSNAPLFATPPGSNVPAPRGMRESPPPSHSGLPENPPPSRSALPENPPPSPSALPENPPPSRSALPENPPPSHSALPEEPPSLPPDVPMHPTLPGNSPPVKPIVNEPPSSPPPEQNFSPILAPPPSISKKTAPMPVAAPANKTAHQYAPVRHSPTEAPIASNPVGHSNSAPKKAAPMPVAAPANKTAHQYAPVRRSPTEAPIASNPVGHSNSAAPPRLFSKSTPAKNHHEKSYKITPPPLPQGIPPTSGQYGTFVFYFKCLNPRTNMTGSSASSPPIALPDNHYSPIPAPSPASPSGQAKIPSVSPKTAPLRPSPRSPKMPFLPPMQALPPPPPHKDCAPLTCTEPLTYGPPQSPCVCVLPIKVGLRLTVALYTFFPLVSELAAEIAAGVFLKQSQVRIMGANAAEENPEKTIVLVDLLPLGEKFDDTTAYLTFQRFWHKQVIIKTLFFGDYDVLYVRYPGLPPSPPLPPSTIGIVSSKPYPGHDNNARTMQPLGVDVSRRQHKSRLSRSILATIILSCFVAAILFCAVAWVLLFRSRYCLFHPDPTPSTTIHSLAKSSGIPASMVGSGPSSPSFSFGSSIAACTGSAKTLSSSDIEKATNFFSETRILGEGGFGRVYSGLLEDGTKIAVKLLKRHDQQGGREFLAEVEMLSRLHHRNLVKLIGICVEDRTRCLIYELIPNGSVESHLHGIDKERSPLDWSARLKIALGAARALAYLHEDSSPPVIHRDFKASNILLEDDFTPKVSDFGLARAALNEENRHISTRVMGTFGYVAPEYAMTGHLLVKSDVYSYGVVLLELLTGRKPVDMSQPPGQENLVTWARPLLTSRDGLEAIIDQSLGPDFPFDSISKVAAIASMCVQPEVSHRPFMGEVVQALKLVFNECEQLKESTSRTCSHEDLSMVTDAGTSKNLDRLPASLLTPSTVSDYDYRLDVERDLAMSELLGSSAMQDSDSFRRYSTSGPLRSGKGKPLWKTMRQLSRGSISEHGVFFRLWPGSH